MEGMPRTRPPHLVYEENRHGRHVWYVRHGHGRRVRLRAEYGTEDFWREYRNALGGTPKPATGPGKNTFAWTVKRYMETAAWAALAPASRKQSEAIFRRLIEAVGSVHIAAITADTIQNSMDKRAATPHAANNYLKAMRRLFKWAAGPGKLVALDPTKDIKLLSGPNDAIGHHTWTEDEMARFEARWSLGTRERLAFDLLLYTGLRRGDVVRFGRQHIKEGIASVRMEKTKAMAYFPILPELLRSIDAAKTGDLTFLITRDGTPFAKGSFANWFARACRAAKCPGSPHGLRKAGATRAAENGATERQLMAIYGWTSWKEAKHYTDAANRKHLAESGGKLLVKNPAPAARKSRTRSKSAG